MKKTFLMPKMMLLAFFFIASIFTRVNAQIIVPDVACLGVECYSQDTLIIYGKNYEQLASIQIYEISELNIPTLKKNINYSNIDNISANLLVIKKKIGKGGNINPNEQNTKKVIGKVYIKDLPISGRYYLININFVSIDKSISGISRFFKRCEQGEGYINNPIKD